MTKNSVQIDLGNVDNTCFIVMPFSSLYQTEYEQIIQPALTELNILCVRGDEIYTKQRIMDDIWHSIRKCRFVLAELTGRNPNVLYEVGLAHAIGKPVIIITRNADDVPFDLQDLRYLYYDVNDPFWGENLKKGIQNLAQKIISNPSIENYLEGITFPKDIKYPEIIEVKKVAVKKNVIVDIKGLWTGKFHDGGNHMDIQLTLQLTQDMQELKGTLLSDYEILGKQTTVQQIMNGYIKKNKVFLHGVNFTYILKGNSGTYHLETYDLELFDNNTKMKGIVSDNIGLNSQVLFEIYDKE